MESKNKILIEYKDTLLDKISSLENEIARRCASSSELTSTTKRQEEISASVHSEVVNELMERNKRSSNVIIYGFVESVGSKQEQLQKDINFVNSILHELDVNATFDAPIRLGKWDPTKQNLARPLKLRLQSSSIAESVLKSSRKLKSKEQWASFTIAQDNTPKQRAMYKAAKCELKSRLDNDEVNLKVMYRNGVPQVTRMGN